jgi:hypothetical protein
MSIRTRIRTFAPLDRVTWFSGNVVLTGTIRAIEAEDGPEAAYVVPDGHDFDTSRLTHLVDLHDLTHADAKAGV